MPTFYEVNSVAGSFREHWWGCKGNPLSFLIVSVAKLIRARTPNASDDANVDSTLPFLVETLSPELIAHFQPLAAQLGEMGFTEPVYHEIHDHGAGIRIYWATFYHPSGKCCARIHNRYWDRTAKRERALFPIFFSFFGDGTFLLSSSGRPDTEEPPTVEMNRMPNASPADLWNAHLRLVDKHSETKPVTRLNGRDLAICATEHLHGRQRDFHLKRGYFKRRSAAEEEQAQQMASTVDSVRAEGSQYPEIVAEIIRLEEKKPRWSKGAWVLGLSFLAFFLSAGAAGWQWSSTLWLIPILFFHESGHWVAMRIFGYRNMRMFFIPLFGAAVSGKHRNVAGWKKAIVSLAGPVPGILLGIGCAIAAAVFHLVWLREATFFLVFINLINLLPFLPLDGGHFLQATLFCRNRWLSMTFQCLAIAGLILMTVMGISRTLMYVGIALAIGLPVAYRTAKVVDHFRRHPLPPQPADDDRVPRGAAEAMITAVKSEMPKAGNRIVAQIVLNIHETLNARPPGILATLGLLGLYGSVIVAGTICFFVLVVANSGGLGALAGVTAGRPKHKVDVSSIEVWRGNKAANKSAGAMARLVSTLKTHEAAKGAFDDATAKLPATATAMRFGDSVILSLPVGDKDSARKWREQLSAQSTNTFLMTNGIVSVDIAFQAPTDLAATNLHNALAGYLDPGMTNLLPPWDPSANNAKFARYRAARGVWRNVSEQLANAWTDSETGTNTLLTAGKSLVKGKDTDMTNIMHLLEQREKLVQQAQARARKKLAAEYESTPYARLVQYELALSDPLDASFTNRWLHADLQAKLARELGAVGTARPAAIAGTAIVMEAGELFRLPDLALADPDTDLPALMQWLSSQGCTHIQYNFPRITYSDNDDEN